MDTSDFDAVAGDFDRFRALPAGVPAAIRLAMWDALGNAPEARVLDLGAGTGRIGEAFTAAGDAYIGVDASARMLARFTEKVTSRGEAPPALAQADGRALPFPAASFDAVLMVQVIGGAVGWRGILSEARRVLRPGGSLVLGKAVGPLDGLDARMRAQLSLILAETGVAMHRRGAAREDALAWLASSARRTSAVVAARWEAMQSPRDYLARHATGARFASLPRAVKDEALRRLSAWAVTTFGSLDAAYTEPRTFVLDIGLFD
jgi:ubiquinone/menaquinone biosynthesis C-methylase UbiE